MFVCDITCFYVSLPLTTIYPSPNLMPMWRGLSFSREAPTPFLTSVFDLENVHLVKFGETQAPFGQKVIRQDLKVMIMITTLIAATVIITIIIMIIIMPVTIVIPTVTMMTIPIMLESRAVKAWESLSAYSPQESHEVPGGSWGLGE